jgi:serpin B
MFRPESALFAVLVSVLFTVFSCGGGGGSSDNTDIVASDLHRNTNPATTSNDIGILVNGNSEFAFNLYQAIKGDEKNLFYSPYSISLALAMTWAGARGNTETQMADTLKFRLPQSKLHPAFNALDLALMSRGQNAKGKDDEPFRLKIANSTWSEETYTFLPEFLDTLALNYGAGMYLADFAGAPDDSRIRINQWVEEKTEQRIKDLIQEGLISTDTRLVLVNAIYFNAAWVNQFQKEITKDGSFNLLEGGAVTVPMMEQSEEFRYNEGDGWQACELMYDGNELSMLMILPGAGKFEQFETGLNSSLIDGIVDGLSSRQVHITMPKFRTETDFMLSDVLAAMGMPDAFNGGVADLSGMDGTRNLYITEVVHKAFVDVDEEGTEAAAATAVIVGEVSAPDPSQFVQFKVDRPFIFLIRDNATNTILFVGRILNPTA